MVNQTGDIQLRFPIPGDLGQVIRRQAMMYAKEYGWDWTYEGLACEILGKFVAEFDASREDAWIAHRGDEIVGSVFLMKSDDSRAGKLRLLYVEPSARGGGLGRRLVNACADRARALGLTSLTLWTNDVLVAARRIYQATGFRLTSENPHRSFGHDLVGQTWTLDLTDDGTAD
jgi:GNAT superfamily N-acetyltransferase